MITSVLLFILGLVLLIFGGNWFVDGAVDIARKYRVPELIIGATIVSVGTTLPEVLVSSQAAVMGHGELAYGNAIGSIICNTALIAALTITVKPSFVNRKTILLPSMFFFGAAALYASTAYISGYFSRAVGIALLVIFAAYTILTIKNRHLGGDESTGEEVSKKPEDISLAKAVVLMIIGAAAIAVGARLLVDNGTIIAEWLGVPESVIGLTFVALGTSLPELVTAVVSLAKGHGALSLGNIIGANLFNLILVSGVAVTARPFRIPESKMIAGMNSSLVLEIPLMILVMAFMTFPVLKTGKTTRFQGITLLIVYAAFCTVQFIM
ncbi:MAG: calcium/sodium antiporter [Lachnospiraceae bacterium]|nr:calcium/sodium antiporter [Lachnospiraceae bacterium]